MSIEVFGCMIVGPASRSAGTLMAGSTPSPLHYKQAYGSR